MGKLMTRRAFVSGAALAAAALTGAGLPACSASSNNRGQSGKASYEWTSVRIGYEGKPEDSVFLAAYEQGFFQKYGISAQLEKIDGSLEDFLSRGTESVFLGDVCLLPQFYQDQSDLDVRFLSAVHSGGITGVCADGAGIASVRDLAGRTVGVLDFSQDPAEAFLKAALVDEGMDFSTVSWQRQASAEKALAAVVEGTLDAFVAADPWGPQGIADQGMVAFYRSAQDASLEGVASCFLVGNAAVYQDDELSGRVAKAVDEAAEWVQQNLAAAASSLRVGGYCTLDAALIQSVLATYTFGDQGSAAFERSLEAQWQLLQKAGLFTKGKTLPELFNASGYYAL